MRVRTYRILKKKYAVAGKLGEGARFYGGRWNNKGTSLIYTAATLSLANLEMVTGMGIYRKDIFVYLEFEFDSKYVKTLRPGDLPKDWNIFPYSPNSQNFGDNWIARNKDLILKVPSSLVDIEYNYLINPSHSAFNKINISKPQKMVFNNRFLSK